MNCGDLTAVPSGNPWCIFLQLKAQQEFFNTLMAYKLKIALNKYNIKAGMPGQARNYPMVSPSIEYSSLAAVLRKYQWHFIKAYRTGLNLVSTDLKVSMAITKY